jgi:hypothetical protein
MDVPAMRSRLIFFGFTTMIYLLSFVFVHANNSIDDVVRQVVTKYELLEAYNDKNDREGKRELNQYVIELNPNWIEERPDLNLLSSNYSTVSKLLIDFNNSRKDNLRFYVIVAGTFYGQLKKDIKIVDLPDKFTTRDFRKLIDTKKDPEDNSLTELMVSTRPDAVQGKILKALEAKGYTERVLYYYAHAMVYNSNQEGNWYSVDNLRLTGDLEKYKKQIASKCRQQWIDPDNLTLHEDTPGSRIQKAVANIITAIGVEYDAGGSSTSGIVNCGKNISDLANETFPFGGSTYNDAVAATAALMDAPRSDQQIKSKYLIVDKPENFTNVRLRDLILPDVIFNTQILPDKLNLLADGKSDYKLYVIFKEVSFVIPDDKRAQFASDVQAASAVARQANTIVMVVPYYSCVDNDIDMGVEGGVVTVYPMLLMPCVYSPDAAMTLLMNAALVREKSFRGGFTQAFKAIPKDYTIFVWTVLWNADAIFEGIEKYVRVTGFSDIVSIRIFQDVRLDQIKEARDKRNCDAEGIIYGTSESMAVYDAAMDRYFTCEKNLSSDIEKIMLHPADFRVLEGPSELIQSELTSNVARQFVETFASRKTVDRFRKISDDLFYGKKNPFKQKDMLLMLIDMASLAAATVGLDFIFDGIGAYYAFSIGEDGQGLMYLAAMAVPLATGGTLRTALVEGKNLVVKGASGVHRIVTREMYGLIFYHRHAGDFSYLMKSVFQPQCFNKVKNYKGESSFIQAVEDGIVSDPHAVQTLNKSPELIDEFHVFHQAGKGNLDDFLKSKKLVLGLDDAVLEVFSRIKEEPGWLTVVVHGELNKKLRVYTGNEWVMLTHRDLARFIRSKTGKPVPKIKLISCWGGMGVYPLSQDLANKLNTIVTAPNVKIGLVKSGDNAGELVSLSSAKGRWETSKPGGITLPTDQALEIRLKSATEKVIALGFGAEVKIDARVQMLLKETDIYKAYDPYLVGGGRQQVYPDILTREEEGIAYYFFTDGSFNVNSALVTGKPLDNVLKAQKEIMEEILPKLQRYNGVVYRGANNAESSRYINSFAGERITFDPFLYTSKSMEKAKEYMSMGGETGNVFFKIHSKGGADLKGIAEVCDHWEEVMYKPKTSFTVFNVADEVMQFSNGTRNVKVIHLIDRESSDALKAVVLKPEFNSGSAEIFLSDNVTRVGAGRLNNEGFIEFEIDVLIGANSAPVASGGSVFDWVYKTVKLNNPGAEIKGIKGLWSLDPPMNSNMNMFNKLLLENKSVEEAALGTFTGIKAKELGYNEVKVKLFPGSVPPHSSANVYFSKVALELD